MPPSPRRGFQENGRDVLRRYAPDGLQVIDGHDVESRHEGNKQFLVVVLAVGRQAEPLEAVVSPQHIDDVASSRGALGELQGCGTGIRTGCAQHHLVQVPRTERSELDGKPHLLFGEEKVRSHVIRIERIAQGINDGLVPPATIEAPRGAEAVVEPLAAHRISEGRPLSVPLVHVHVGGPEIRHLPLRNVPTEEVLHVVPLLDAHLSRMLCMSYAPP